MTTSRTGWSPVEGPERRYPARADAQSPPRDERAICSRCLGGTCCTTEGPIALTPFDVLRLSAALDLAPAEFFRLFTQDRFEGAEAGRYGDWLADPDNSVISFLRRRTLEAASPCIFLKYIAESDGTPRRVCSVHPARPLACREYYHDTCKKRWTGEMAVLQAAGYEAVRDRKVDADEVDQRVAACGPVTEDEPLSVAWRRAFWLEMRRALQPGAANEEGCAEPRLVELQDPMADKINRLLSTPHLRFEEKYGPTPIAEQLHAFDAGLSLRDSGERARLLDIATRPAAGRRLFNGDDLRPHLGVRRLVIDEPAASPSSRADELLRFARRARQTPDQMELERAVTLHIALFVALRRQPEAGQPAMRTALAWHAAAALMHGKASVQAGAPFDESQLEGANALAVLAQAGYREAATPLRRWLASSRAAPCGRFLTDTAASLHGASPSAAEAARWLPLIAFGQSAEVSGQGLATVWTNSRLARLDADSLLTLADHSLRQPGFDRSLLTPAITALAAFSAAEPRSMWDARPADLGDCWHDAYVLRAIERAGLLADARAVIASDFARVGTRR